MSDNDDLTKEQIANVRRVLSGIMYSIYDDDINKLSKEQLQFKLLMVIENLELLLQYPK